MELHKSEWFLRDAKKILQKVPNICQKSQTISRRTLRNDECLQKRPMSHKSAKPLESLRMTFSTPYQTLNCHINIKRSKISFKQWRITQRKRNQIQMGQKSSIESKSLSIVPHHITERRTTPRRAESPLKGRKTHHENLKGAIPFQECPINFRRLDSFPKPSEHSWKLQVDFENLKSLPWLPNQF